MSFEFTMGSIQICILNHPNSLSNDMRIIITGSNNADNEENILNRMSEANYKYLEKFMTENQMKIFDAEESQGEIRIILNKEKQQIQTVSGDLSTNTQQSEMHELRKEANTTRPTCQQIISMLQEEVKDLNDKLAHQLMINNQLRGILSKYTNELTINELIRDYKNLKIELAECKIDLQKLTMDKIDLSIENQKLRDHNCSLEEVFKEMKVMIEKFVNQADLLTVNCEETSSINTGTDAIIAEVEDRHHQKFGQSDDERCENLEEAIEKLEDSINETKTDITILQNQILLIKSDKPSSCNEDINLKTNEERESFLAISWIKRILQDSNFLTKFAKHYNVMNDEQIKFIENSHGSVQKSPRQQDTLSISEVFTKLQNLIFQKSYMQRESNELKVFHSYLLKCLDNHNNKLSNVCSELKETWKLVEKIKAQQNRLHTHEQILCYQLQQKRQKLIVLKAELEYCRKRWALSKKLIKDAEKQFGELHQEFSARKIKDQSSPESGFNDEIPNDSENGYKIVLNEFSQVEQLEVPAIFETCQVNERCEPHEVCDEVCDDVCFSLAQNFETLSEINCVAVETVHQLNKKCKECATVNSQPDVLVYDQQCRHKIMYNLRKPKRQNKRTNSETAETMFNRLMDAANS